MMETLRLAQRARNISPSATLAIDARAKALASQGVRVLNFGVGEPDFDTPEHIKLAAVEALRRGETKYTPVAGTLRLRQAIADKLQRENGLTYAPETIVVSSGAKHSLYNALQVLCQEGDEVVLPVPYWVSYFEQVKLAGAVPVPVATGPGFKLDPGALRRACNVRTRLVIINSPSNPTGAVYTREELAALAEVIVERNLAAISDEIYEKLVYDGAGHVSLASLGPEIKERTVTVNGLSKAYAMTGWRIGYAAGPSEAIQAAINLQSQSTSNPTSISQKAGVEALTGPQDTVAAMVKEFAWRRDDIYNRIRAIPGLTTPKPGGAFYIFPNFSAYYDRLNPRPGQSHSQALAEYLLEEARVAAVPGAEFGEDRCIRLSYATSRERIATGVERIAAALRNLGK